MKGLEKAAIATHTGADGDAVGSAVALLYLLRYLDAEAMFCYSEEVPDYLCWLLPRSLSRSVHRITTSLWSTPPGLTASACEMGKCAGCA